MSSVNVIRRVFIDVEIILETLDADISYLKGSRFPYNRSFVAGLRRAREYVDSFARDKEHIILADFADENTSGTSYTAVIPRTKPKFGEIDGLITKDDMYRLISKYRADISEEVKKKIINDIVIMPKVVITNGEELAKTPQDQA